MVTVMPRSESDGTRHWRLIAHALSLIVALIGIVVVIGWVLNVTALKSVFPGLVSMKANTAIGMLLCGVALALLSRRRVTKRIRYLAAVAAFVATALGALTLSQYVVGWDLRIDQWLFSDLPGAIGTSQPGRMSPASSVCFVLAGAALLTVAQRTLLRVRQPIVAGLAVSLIVIGALALRGYLLEAGLGYHWWNYTGTAVHTATGFVLLGSGLLALVRSEGGLTWSLDTINTAAFVAAVVLMVIAAGSAYNLAKQLQETAIWVSHTQEVLKEIQDVATDVTAVESAQRGYIITGDERLLTQFTQAKARVPAALADVRKLVGDDNNQQRRLGQIESLITQRFEFADRTIAARSEQGFAAAQQMVATGTGTALTDRINGLHKDMQDDERTLLNRRQKQSEAASVTTFLLLPLGLFLTLTTLSLGVFLLNAGVEERSQAERAAAVSQARMAGIVNSAMDAIISVDREQRIVLFNAAAEKMLRCSVADALGQSIDKFIPQRFREQHHGHVEGFGKTGVTSRSMRSLGTLNGLRADGEEFPIEASISQIEVAVQKIYTVVLRDITERQKAEAAGVLLAAIVESSFDAIIGKDVDGIVTSWNAGAERMFGYAAGEMIGYSITKLIPPDREDDEERILAQIRRGEGVEHFETVRVRKDGGLIDVSVTVSPIKNATGEIIGASKVARDITERKRAEESLRDTQARLNSTLAAGSIGTWSWDIVNDRLFADEFTARMFSIEADAAAKGLPATAYLQVIREEDRPGVEDALASAIQSCGHYDIEYRVRQKDGGFRWLQARGRVEGDETGKALNFHGAVMDITERKQAEQALRVSEERLRTVTDNARVGLVMVNRERRYTFANATYVEILDLPSSDLVGQGVADVLATLYEEQIRPRLDRAFAGERVAYELRKPATNGDHCYAVRYEPTSVDGTVSQVVVVITDITERRQAEEALDAERNLLRTLIDLLPDYIYLKDMQGQFLACNEACAQLMGAATPAALTGKTDADFYPARMAAEFRADELAVLEGTPLINQEEPFTRPDGTREFVVTTKLPIKDSSGKITGLVGYGRNVTASRQAEEALRASEERLRLSQQVVRIGTFEWNIQTGVNQWTPELEAMYGLPQGDFVGSQQTWEQLIFSEDRAEAVRQVSLAMEGKNFEAEWRVVWPDGTVHWLAGRARVFEDETGKPLRLLGVNIDITERKLAEKRIQHLNRVYAVLSDINQMIVRTRNPQAIFAEACRIAVDKGEFRMAWIGLLDRENQRIEPQAWAGAEDGYLRSINIDMRNEAIAQGQTPTAVREAQHVVCNDLENDPRMAPWREEVLKRGYRSSAAFPLKVDDVIVGNFNLYASEPGFFDDEEVALLDELALDISFALEVDRRENERQRAETALRIKSEELTAMTQQLLQASKLATMGELAASIAHELNNPLATVALRTESLLRQTPEDQEKRRALTVIAGEVDRMSTLVNNLLQFSRRSHRQISTVDVREEIGNSVEFVHYYLRTRKIEVMREFADLMPSIQADRQQLRQLFLNLLTKAGDAMPQGGKLTSAHDVQ